MSWGRLWAGPRAPWQERRHEAAAAGGLEARRTSSATKAGAIATLTSYLTPEPNAYRLLCRPLSLGRLLALKKEYPAAKLVVGNTGECPGPRPAPPRPAPPHPAPPRPAPPRPAQPCFKKECACSAVLFAQSVSCSP